jgi:hypothetical protein
MCNIHSEVHARISDFFFQFSDAAPLALPKKDLALNGNRTGKGVDFFCIAAFIWRPTGGGCLNLAKPAQNLYFLDDFFSNFQRICDRISLYLLLLLLFSFWRNLANIKNAGQDRLILLGFNYNCTSDYLIYHIILSNFCSLRENLKQKQNQNCT